MNPFPIVRATVSRHWAAFILFTLIVSVAVAIGIAISAQERALRSASARAADKFDVLLAAPGSQLDVVLTAIYLRPGTVPLLEPAAFAAALNDPRVKFAAPVAFGDSYRGAPIIGTIPDFVTHLSGGLAEGSLFATETEAVIGAASRLKVGDVFKPSHGLAPAGHPFAQNGHGEKSADGKAAHEDDDDDHPEHDINIRVTGRMKPTGTPWDRAILVPVEQVWRTHSLPNGHAPGDARIGPPFQLDQLSPVPVVVIKPVSVGGAYALRGAYRTSSSMAFFPAEVLVQLYNIMGNIQSLLSALSLAAQALVILALLAGVFAILSLSKRQFAVLRVLGAPAGYIILCVWCYVALIILSGVTLGLGLGILATSVASSLIADATGIAMAASIGAREWQLLAVIIGIGFVMALYPAFTIAARKPLEGLMQS